MRKLHVLLILMIAGIISCTSEKNETDSGKISVYALQKEKNSEDPFLQNLYWELNNSPMQEKLRNIKPFPVGVVYYQQYEDDLERIKDEFNTIKGLGYTALKQVLLRSPKNPSDFEKQVFHTALDAGLSPWYYGKGGWAPIDQSLIDQIGVNIRFTSENFPEIQNHPKMIDYQREKIMRPRIALMDKKPSKPKGMGEPGRNNPWLPSRLVFPFSQWLQKTYGTIDSLNLAWNTSMTGTSSFHSFFQAAKFMEGTGFDEYGAGMGNLVWELRRYRDAMKFQSELIVQNYLETMELYTKWDPLEPERTGGHQLFENQAANTWDLEGQAKAASVGGSFYASIHYAHHFFLLDGEFTRPAYLQSRIVADMFKGGWAATWESTGGPTWYSGYHPTSVDKNVMRQLMCSYIATGLKGVGLWTWNSRGEGWEVGEYALTDIQGEPTGRAKMAGHISNILQDQRFELWEAMDEPVVGILYSWETDAMLGRMSLGGYSLQTYVYETDFKKQFRQYHAEARIGASRAFMDNNIPFEYLTERDLAAGLAQRYPIIYMPYILTLKQSEIATLKEYVKNGGRLVADFPVLMIDDFGRLNKAFEGGDFEELFGFQPADYFHTFDMPRSFKGHPVDNSQFGILKVTSADILSTFNDGSPAVLRNQYGKGSVTTFNFEISRNVYKPGNIFMQDQLVHYALGNIRPPFMVKNTNNTMVFRRSAPKADHYIFLNDGPEETVTLTSRDIEYTAAKELIDDLELRITNNGFCITVPANSATWVRAIKK